MTQQNDLPADPELSEPTDAFSARLKREPIASSAPIDIILLTQSDDQSDPGQVSAAETIRKKGRLGAIIQISTPQMNAIGVGPSLVASIREVRSPLVVLTRAETPWNRDIIDRLLKAIQQSDITLGVRPCNDLTDRWKRTVAAEARGWFWGAGVLDPHSPYRMFRTEPLKSIPIESLSSFADIEIIAKCNFLDGLIHQEIMPASESWRAEASSALTRQDKRRLFKNPQFRFKPA